MREILDHLVRWQRDHVKYALATVIDTHGSAPLGAGTTMAISDDGVIVGSISGGCIEGAVIDIALDVIATGHASRQRFTISDDDAFGVGLTCGGTLDVFINSPSPAQQQMLETVRDATRQRIPVGIATVIDEEEETISFVFDGRLQGSTGDPGLDARLESHMSAMLSKGESSLTTATVSLSSKSSAELFVHSFAHPPRMIVFGAIDYARAVTRIGKLMGYFVTVCDARSPFATQARFPEADEVVVDWPDRYLTTQILDERSVLCVLTHEEKFDVPLLARALRLDVAYVGAMGSRSTCLNRERELRSIGLTDTELDRLHAPIGLDIGGRTPAEAAVSIAAEIVASREGRPGTPLRDSAAPIHPRSIRLSAG